MRVRPAVKADAAGIAVVHVRSWQGAYRGVVPDAYLDALSVERRTEVWSEILGQVHVPSTGAFVLEEGDDVVGFAHISPTRDDDMPTSTGELTGIYLLPSVWGRGGGRLLIHAGQDSLKAAGFTTATLWVLDGNTRARRFYERQGWIADGTTKLDHREGFTLVEVRYVTTL